MHNQTQHLSNSLPTFSFTQRSFLSQEASGGEAEIGGVHTKSKSWLG